MKKRFVSLILACLAGILCISLSACGQQDGDVDVGLEDIRAINSLEALLDRYDNVFIEEDVVSINGYVESTAYYKFEMADGRYVGDFWNRTEGDGDESGEVSAMVVNARDGVIYGIYDGERDAVIVPEADYNDRVEQMYPLFPTAEEEVVSAVKEGKEILVTTVRETFADGSPSLGAEYRLNARTLRIKSLRINSYNEKGQKTQIIGMTVTHNSKEAPDRSAWETISQPEDGALCRVTAVIGPGTEQEETRDLPVARSCSVTVAGKNSYDLYSDEACSTLLPLVDTTGESVTFYAKAAQ